ncbi:MAG: hypothetical protein HZA93_29310 [Verrucomicrobia bacterium]|nr:hypothetical protein [Verrucomicrobiota bacterium]
MPSKIESSLTPEQFWSFCDAVAKLKGGRKGATLREIQRLAAEWDIGYVSTNSAKAFRDGAFSEFLADLRADKELAAHIAGVTQAGLGLDDAASKVLEKKIFKTTLGMGDHVDPETADLMSKSIERIRTSNRHARRLESDLQVAAKKIEVADKQLALRDEQIAKLTAEREEREAKLRAVAQQVDRAKNAPAASADEVRAAAVAEIDRIMGITPKAPPAEKK